MLSNPLNDERRRVAHGEPIAQRPEPRSTVDPRLIDATGAAIARWGLAETSLNRIAAEADMGRATFYRRGVTRDQLVAALTEKAAETFRASLWPTMIGTGTAAERLRAALEAMCVTADGHDLVDEETLRTVGHSTFRADFGIPSLGLLIEVKYARKASDFKDFEKQIYEDYVAYLTDNEPYRKMAVFIYDESLSTQEHGTTRNALLKLPDISDVIVTCRPSHVPVPERITRRRVRPVAGPDDATNETPEL